MINASDYIVQSKYIDKFNFKKNFLNKKLIYFVRIAFHLKEIKYALKINSILKSYGYFVGLNLMQISRLKTKEIEYASKLINKAKPDVFYIADSLGVVKEKSLIKINKLIRKYWKGQLGIHAHDNLKLALKMGYNIAIITGGREPNIKERLEKLGIDNVFLNAHNKLPILKKYLSETFLN